VSFAALEFSSELPLCLILGLVLIVSASPLMRLADAPPTDTKSRVENLDGLRGFLALAVFFSHTLVYHNYLIGGRWALTASPTFTMLGEAGVSVFFMITGYLFWSQLLGKEGKPDWVKLYVGRLFRILPLYWFAVGLVIVGVVCHTGPRLYVPLSSLAAELAQWAAGGLRREIPINGYVDAPVLIAGVTWTLGYEWKFYAALLPLSLLARAKGWLRLAPLLLLACVLGYLFVRARPPGGDLIVCCALFLSGMTAASVKAIDLKPAWANHLASATVVAVVIGVFVLFNDIYAPAPIALLAACFYLVVSGATGFGLLRTQPARRLGNISFGIYLLQGPVLAATFLVPGARSFALSSPLAHWIVMTLDGIALVLVAAAIHALVERPGIALGKNVLARFAMPQRLPLRSPAGPA
jgi:peptidoglycan/LPS O-acetylase OafA/YrhL